MSKTEPLPWVSEESLAKIERDLARGFIEMGTAVPKCLVSEIRRLQSELIGLRAMRDEIESRIKQHEDNLEQWQNGYLTPTEPDAEERTATMERLKVAIHVLKDVLHWGN